MKLKFQGCAYSPMAAVFMSRGVTGGLFCRQDGGFLLLCLFQRLCWSVDRPAMCTNSALVCVSSLVASSFWYGRYYLGVARCEMFSGKYAVLQGEFRRQQRVVHC